MVWYVMHVHIHIYILYIIVCVYICMCVYCMYVQKGVSPRKGLEMFGMYTVNSQGVLGPMQSQLPGGVNTPETY